MKKIVISILILLILLLLFVIFKRERFQNVDGNYKISELIDFEEIRSIFRVESEEIQPQTYQTSTQPVPTDEAGFDILGFLMGIEPLVNYNSTEQFQNLDTPDYSVIKIKSEGENELSFIENKIVTQKAEYDNSKSESFEVQLVLALTNLGTKFLKAAIRDNLEKTINNPLLNVHKIKCFESSANSDCGIFTDLTVPNTIGGTIVPSYELNPVNGSNGLVDKLNKFISDVLHYGEVKKILKKDQNMLNTIKSNLNAILNELNHKYSDTFPIYFNLNFTYENDDYNFFLENISINYPQNIAGMSEETSATQLVSTTPASNQLVINEYDITFTKVKSQSQGQLKNSYSLSIPSNEGISLSEGDLNVIEISTPGIFTLKFINFSDKKIELDKGFRINIKSDNVTIDGGNNMIYINNNLITNGLITNNDNFPNLKTTQGIQSAINDGIKGVSNCVVKNFDVHFNVSSGEKVRVLNNEDGAGLLCSNYFGALGENNIVKNCVVHGSVFANNGGSIVGSYAGFGGSLIISGCIYIGNLQVVFGDNDTDYYYKSCGGIAGSNLGSFGKVLVHDCITTGHINTNFSGGICGKYVGSDGGNVVISNCTMLGDIYGFSGEEYGCGGICGADCATDMQYYENNNLKTRVFIINCNVLGKMGMYGSNNGGFVGSNVALGGDLYIIGCRTHFDTAMMIASHGYFIGSNATDSEAENSKIYVICCSNKSFTSDYPPDLLIGTGILDDDKVINLSDNPKVHEHYLLSNNELEENLNIRKQFPITSMSMNHNTKLVSIDDKSIFDNKTSNNIYISLSENWKIATINPICNTNYSMNDSSQHFKNLHVLKNTKLNNLCSMDQMDINLTELHNKYQYDYSTNTNFNACKYKSLQFCNNETNCSYSIYSRQNFDGIPLGSDYMCLPTGTQMYDEPGGSGQDRCSDILRDPDNPGYDQCMCAIYYTEDSCNANQDCEWETAMQRCEAV